MTVGIIRETLPETRVAMVPETIKTLMNVTGLRFVVESGAGSAAGFTDDAYAEAGATIAPGRKELMNLCNILLFVQPFYDGSPVHESKTFIGIFNPLNEFDHLLVYQNRPITAYSLDMVPRSTIAQSMDVLSSMASLAGYRAVLKAAAYAPNPLPMLTTAAGTIKPAQVLVLGTGVAGLQAIATARRLGAKVQAYDVRSSSKEEVSSLGARFIEIAGSVENKNAGGYAIEQTADFKEKQRAVIHEHALQADIVITTAQIPGKKAPLLVGKNTVDQMRKGAVIVDLAASTGGNCELTENGKDLRHGDVSIIGNSYLAREVPTSASRLLSANFAAFIKHYLQKLNEEKKDEILEASCILKNGKIVHPMLIKDLV